MRSTRQGDRLELVRPASSSVVAAVEATGDGPWRVVDSAGAVLGELVAGRLGPSTQASWWEILDDLPTAAADNARTMHLGLRRVLQYSFARAESGVRLDAAIALLPLVAGLTY
jgi:hypothetical protein